MRVQGERFSDRERERDRQGYRKKGKYIKERYRDRSISDIVSNFFLELYFDIFRYVWLFLAVNSKINVRNYFI